MADISKITVPISGTATTYNIKDASAIANLSVSGKVITFTKRDGSTGTITTQDTNTTYSAATTSANGLMSAADKTKLNATNIAYCTCSTAADTAAKIVTVVGNDNWTLQAGAIILVKFTNTNTASSVTLNVNSTGAKSIYYSNAVITNNSPIIGGYAGRNHMYVYDGTYWVWISASNDSNTTYTNASLGQGYGTCATAEATAAKVVSLSSYALTVGGVVAVKFTYAVPASATMNINSKGAKTIYYRGAAITAGVIKAGDTATFIYNGSQYHLLTVDRDNDTNTDTKVTQTITTSNAKYPLLLAPSGQTATKTTNSYFDSGVTLNPSTNTITANISGSSTSCTGNASTATKLSSSGKYTVTIDTSDWITNADGGYIATKTVTGVLTTDSVIADLVCSTDISAAKLQISAWGCVCNGNIIVSSNNTVKFYTYDTQPTVAITVELQVIR